VTRRGSPGLESLTSNKSAVLSSGLSARLVCTRCGGPVVENENAVVCSACGKAYQRISGVPVFLEDAEWNDVQKRIARERAETESYSAARRKSPLSRQYYDYWMDRLLRHAPTTREDLLVELMCGEAEVCRRLVPGTVGSALALDLNMELVAHAARDLRGVSTPKTTFVCGTATHVPLPDESAAVVAIVGGLHHARPLLLPVLREVARILRPGGVLVGSEPANDNVLIRAIRHWQYSHSALQGHDADEDGFTSQELSTALSSAGLRLERYDAFGFVAYPFMGNTDILPLLARSRSRALGRSLLALDAFLEQVPVIRRFGWASLYLARKESLS
jgi:ubiquinone/menaquinone biosynthesis C-methylase UbiE/uncharacterized protein YbaR (Trm112 family)